MSDPEQLQSTGGSAVAASIHSSSPSHPSRSTPASIVTAGCTLAPPSNDALPSSSPLSGVMVAHLQRERSDGAAGHDDGWGNGDVDSDEEFQCGLAGTSACTAQSETTTEYLPQQQQQQQQEQQQRSEDTKGDEEATKSRCAASVPSASVGLAANLSVATPNDSLRFGLAGCSGSRRAQATVDALLSPGLGTGSPHEVVASATVHPFPLSVTPALACANPCNAAALPGRASTAVSLAPPPLPPRPLWLQQKIAATVEPVSRLLGPRPLLAPSMFPVYASAAFSSEAAGQTQTLPPAPEASALCIASLDGSYFSPGANDPISPTSPTSPFEMADSPVVGGATSRTPGTGSSSSFHMRSPLHAHEVYGLAPLSPPSVSRSVSVSSSLATDEGHSMDVDVADGSSTPSAFVPVRKGSHHAAPMALCDSITECDDEGEGAWRSAAADELYSLKQQQPQQLSFVAVAEIISEAPDDEGDEEFEFV